MGNGTQTVQEELSVLMVTGTGENVERARSVLGAVEPRGALVHVEETLGNALAAMEAKGFDLVLLDLSLPDSDGMQTLFKAREVAGNTPIIVLSGCYDPAMARQIVDEGGQGYLAGEEMDRFLLRTAYIALGRAELRREALAAQQRMEKLVAEAQDAILVLDEQQTIRFANPAASRLFVAGGDSLIGRPFGYPATGGEVVELDVPLQDGQARTVEMRVSNTEWRGNVARLIILRDVTERKLAEMALRSARDELERRVRERTVELEETNTALKVLLKKREEDRIHTEDNIVYNARELLLPFLERLKNTRLDAQQKVFVDILEHNVDEIISPLVRDLHRRFSNLTPMEIRIATLLQTGKTAKEMAQMLNVSVNTVKTHKAHLRHKLGLKKQDVNLRSFLTAMKKSEPL